MDFIQSVLQQAGDHVPLVLACVFLFAAADAALGIGAVLPGETGVVLAAVALSDRTMLVALAVGTAAAGGFVGDHIGFLVGRVSGPRLDRSRLIRRVGHEHWEQAKRYVADRFWIIVVARLMPGIRTLVAAAAGASRMRYLRFATACGVAAALWAAIWVIGGAILGNVLLEVAERYTLPVLLIAAAVVVATIVRRVSPRSRA